MEWAAWATAVVAMAWVAMAWAATATTTTTGRIVTTWEVAATEATTTATARTTAWARTTTAWAHPTATAATAMTCTTTCTRRGARRPRTGAPPKPRARRFSDDGRHRSHLLTPCARRVPRGWEGDGTTLGRGWGWARVPVTHCLARAPATSIGLWALAGEFVSCLHSGW